MKNFNSQRFPAKQSLIYSRIFVGNSVWLKKLHRVNGERHGVALRKDCNWKCAGAVKNECLMFTT